jgi:ABC-type lipoprotein release transport system permease subunit
MLIFLLGLLLGVLIGGALCVSFLRREIAANVGPQIRQLTLKIDTLESALNLALATRQTELTSYLPASGRNPRS